MPPRGPGVGLSLTLRSLCRRRLDLRTRDTLADHLDDLFEQHFQVICDVTAAVNLPDEIVVLLEKVYGSAVVAEHGDRSSRVARHDDVVRLELFRRVLGEVREPREVREGAAAVHAGERVLADDVGARHRGDFAESLQRSAVGEGGVSRDVERARSGRARDDRGGALLEEPSNLIRVHRLGLPRVDGFPHGHDLAQSHEGAIRPVWLFPASVVRDDDGRHAALGRRRRVALAPPRRLDRVDGVRAHRARDVGGADPGADGGRERLDIRLE